MDERHAGLARGQGELSISRLDIVPPQFFLSLPIVARRIARVIDKNNNNDYLQSSILYTILHNFIVFTIVCSFVIFTFRYSECKSLQS